MRAQDGDLPAALQHADRQRVHDAQSADHHRQQRQQVEQADEPIQRAPEVARQLRRGQGLGRVDRGLVGHRVAERIDRDAALRLQGEQAGLGDAERLARIGLAHEDGALGGPRRQRVGDDAGHRERDAVAAGLRQGDGVSDRQSVAAGDRTPGSSTAPPSRSALKASRRSPATKISEPRVLEVAGVDAGDAHLALAVIGRLHRGELADGHDPIDARRSSPGRPAPDRSRPAAVRRMA